MRWTLAAYLDAAKASLQPADHANFAEATGSTVAQLLELVAAAELQQPGPLLRNLTSSVKLMLHPLNAYGLHPFRSLIAERLNDRLRATSPLAADVSVEPLVHRFRSDGVVMMPIALEPASPQAHGKVKPQAHGKMAGLRVRLDSRVQRLMRAISGWQQPWFSTDAGGVLLGQHTHFDGDIQHYAHVDTHSQCLKAFAFPPGTVVAHGPFHYVNGSHRNTVGELRWLFDRTRHLTGDEPIASSLPMRHLASNAQIGPSGLPFSDWSHGVHESIRFEGVVPQGPPPGRDWAYDFGRYSFPPPRPMLPTAGTTQATLVIADTAGIHFRGWAPAGTMRQQAGFHRVDVNRHSPWDCVRRLRSDRPC